MKRSIKGYSPDRRKLFQMERMVIIEGMKSI
jgi:hypothetical protein